MEILDVTFNNFQKEPEKYVKYLLKFFIDKKEREFKTNDGIKFSLDYQGKAVHCYKIAFEKNRIRLSNIKFSIVNGIVIYSKRFDLGDGYIKLVSSGVYYGKDHNGERYHNVYFFKEINNERIYFRVNGAAYFSFNYEWKLVEKNFYLFGNLVAESEYRNFIKKIKNGTITKNLNRYKRIDRIEEIYEFAKFYKNKELMEKCEFKLMLGKLEGKWSFFFILLFTNH